jgi:hypothetical protein
MQVVAYLFTGSGELDWATTELLGILMKGFKTILEIADQDTAVFYSDNPDLLAQASHSGLSAVLIEVAPEDPHQPDALFHLVTPRALQDSPTLFLDLRNPLLSTELGIRALALYHAHEKPVIGLRTPVDHPYFLYSAGRLLSCGLLHFFKQPFDDGCNEVVTRPFYFDWDRYAQNVDGSAAGGENAQKAHLVREDALTARAVFTHFSQMNAGWRVLGSSVPCELKDRSELILLCDQDEELRLSHFWRGRISAECVAFDSRGLLPDRRFRVVFSGDAACLDTRAMQDVLDPTCSGWLYFLEEKVEEGEIGEERPFIPSEPCWAGVTNLITEQRIYGRQQLPEVWEPDMSFVLCLPNQIFQLVDMMNQGGLCGLAMHGNKIFLRTRFDLLQFRAWHRVRKQMENA